MVDGYTHGFKLGLDKKPAARPPCQNSRAAEKHPEVVADLIKKEIERGHMLGPFNNPPIEDMVFSPIHIVPKAGNPGKWWLIHDLAYPWDGKNSINACIPESNASVNYRKFDDVVEMGVAIGTGAWGARIDIKHAFRNQPIHPEDLKYLGFTFQGKFHINSSIPFGAASSCAIFEKVTSALQWIVSNETRCFWTLHFLDDFPLVEKSCDELQDFMSKFTAIMTHIGMPVVVEKTLGPTQELTYLGLLINFPRQVIGIPQDKRQKCVQLIKHMQEVFTSRRKTTIKKIQQLAGSLNFLCQALLAGRPFLASLYPLTRFNNGEKRRAGNHRRLSKETYLDLTMFKSFLDIYGEEKLHTVPFLRQLNIEQDNIQLYADAAGASDKGLGCYYEGQWFQGKWQDTTLFHNGYTPNIALLEMLAIVIAFELWAPHL